MNSLLLTFAAGFYLLRANFILLIEECDRVVDTGKYLLLSENSENVVLGSKDKEKIIFD